MNMTNKLQLVNSLEDQARSALNELYKLGEHEKIKAIVKNCDSAYTKEVVAYGNKDVSNMILALKEKAGVTTFVDSSMERNMAKHCVNLMGKLGKDEFVRRFEFLLADDFHAKNCNKIRYIYNNIKGFIEPKLNII